MWYAVNSTQALLTVAHHADSRRCLLLMEAVLKTPALVDRLFEVLKPVGAAKPAPARKKLARSNAR